MDPRTNNHWIYNVELNGMNLRMNDFQCALGISQLKKLGYFLKRENPFIIIIINF